MKNNYQELKDLSNPLRKFTSNPLFGFVILALIMVVIQLLFMFTDGIISLTISQAIAQTMIYSVVCLGLAILEVRAGLTSLGTAGFMGLGTFIAGNLLKYFHLPYVLILVGVIVAGIVLGIVVGFISLRVEGIHLLIITLVLSQILSELFIVPNKFTGGASGLMGIPFPKLAMLIKLNRDTTFFLILAVLFIMIVLTLNIINSPTGRAMLAMRASRPAAVAMGVNILKYRILAFVIATAYAMLGGALYVSYVQGSSPVTWTTMLSFNVIVAVVLGGGMSIAGVMLGTFVVFGLDLAVYQNIPFFQKYSSSSIIFNGLLIILIVIKYPGGLERLLFNIKGGVNKLYIRWRVYRYGEGN